MQAWLERNRSNLAAGLVVLVAVAAFALLQAPRRPALQVTTSPTNPLPIKVHVAGAVVVPGVYPLAADARVEDALKAAGGPSDVADLRSLNLATPLRDGQQVVIPHILAQAAVPGSAAQLPLASPVAQPSLGGSAAPATALPPPARPAGRMDLNTATQRQLEELPGIGPVTAQRILEHRQKNGRIRSVEELRDAKVINASVYERIKDLVEAR